MGADDQNPLNDAGATVVIREFRAGQKVFHRYTLMRELGRGGMGVVWLAHDDKLETDVALKFLPESVRLDPNAVDELKRETRRSLKLTHPNIVRIHDFVDDETTAGISMEFIDGSTLAGLRSRQPKKIFSPDELAPLIRQLCAALDYAHNEAKVIHRDLKPSNLMVTSKRQIKVADFGIARSVSDSMSRVTVNQGTSGTLVYMSPQQLAGIPSTATDDVYALGATIYELLAGRPPFYSGDIPYQIRTVTPPTIAERWADLEIETEPLPAHWEQVIASCLAKDPVMRPQSAGAVAAGLRLALDSTTTSLTAPTAPYAPTAAPTRNTGPGQPGSYGSAAVVPPQPPTRIPTQAPTGGGTAPPLIDPPSSAPPTAGVGPSGTQRVSTATEAKKKSPAGLMVMGAIGILALLAIVWFIATRHGEKEAAVQPVTPPAQSNVVQTGNSDETKKLQDEEKALEETRKKVEEDAKAIEAARIKADEETKQQAAAEAQAKADEAARQKANAEAQAKAEAEAKQRAEADVNRAPMILAVPGSYATIQGAMDFAKSGDTIQVGPGIYEEKIRFKEGVRLIGAGMNAVTVRYPSGVVFEARKCASGQVSGITFEPAGVPSSENHFAVAELLDSNVEMSGCAVRNSGGIGLFINGGWNMVHDCSFKQNASSGIAVGNKAAPTLTDNQCSSNTVSGIVFETGASGEATGNTCLDNQTDGIFAGGEGTAPTLKRNKCISNGKMGIGINNRASAVAEGNTCERNNQCGIAVLSGASGTLSGNHCTKNVQHGIDFGGRSTGRLERNFCLDNGACGILLDGEGTTTHLMGNQCNFNSQWGICSQNGASSEIDTFNLAKGNHIGQIQR